MTAEEKAHIITDLALHASQEALKVINRIAATAPNDEMKAQIMLLAGAAIGGRGEAIAETGGGEILDLYVKARDLSFNAQVSAQRKSLPPEAIDVAARLGMMMPAERATGR